MTRRGPLKARCSAEPMVGVGFEHRCPRWCECRRAWEWWKSRTFVRCTLRSAGETYLEAVVDHGNRKIYQVAKMMARAALLTFPVACWR
jgi:hypothetical protein